MHNAQTRTRRPQDAQPDDDDVMSRLASRRGREFDRGRAGYADYSQHSSEPYRQNSYDTTSSSSRRRADWHAPEPSRPAHDTYYTQEYHRPREDYDTEAWSSRPQGRYPNATHDWDPSYPKPSYSDAGWSVAEAPAAQYDRQVPFVQRGHDDSRSGWSDARGQGHDREQFSWRRDDTRDAGWSSRPRIKDQHDPNRQWTSDAQTAEDRRWQPAASWQPNQSRGDNGQGSRYQNGRNYNPNNFNQKKSNKKKKNRFGKQQQGYPDAGQDNSHVNNWQRNDKNGSSRTQPKKKQGRSSRSRSRSRSVSSYSSRSSSRRRSRTDSPRSPRRPERTSSSRSPEKSRGSGKKYESRSHRSRSRSHSRSRDRSRRRGRTPSTGTSRSHSRSRSPSPPPKPKAIHRLPPATSIHDFTLPSRNALGMVPPRAHLKESVRGDSVVTIQSTTAAHSVASMPPPITPVSSSTRESSPVQLGEQPAEDTSVDVVPMNLVSSDKPGFKPIGQPATAVKRLFPGDESELPIPTVIDQDVTMSATTPLPTSTMATTTPSSQAVITAAEAGRSAPKRPSLEHRTGRSAKPAKPGQLYSIMSQVGEGTFGKVYKARNTISGVYVALKRIRMESEKDGFPVTAMREIKLLQSLSHDNVVRLYEMMVSDGNVYMVFEYMDHDLTGILSQTQFSFTAAHLKSFCQQMLQGLAYLHHKSVVHRDIKGSNILVNQQGVLKLADFGLARWYQKRRRNDYTNRVITLWYRPPELLFGATVYGPEVDMWSAGCIMLELFTKKPIFQGNDEIHQLDVIYKVLGTLTSERWSGVSDLPWYELVKPKDATQNHFRTLFQKWLSPAAMDLAESLLAYDPQVRVTAAQALEAPYFRSEQPGPELPTRLSEIEGEWHELETKLERAKKRRRTEPSASSQQP